LINFLTGRPDFGQNLLRKTNQKLGNIVTDSNETIENGKIMVMLELHYFTNLKLGDLGVSPCTIIVTSASDQMGPTFRGGSPKMGRSQADWPNIHGFSTFRPSV
jgi:hypothetical protein